MRDTASDGVVKSNKTLGERIDDAMEKVHDTYAARTAAKQTLLDADLEWEKAGDALQELKDEVL